MSLRGQKVAVTGGAGLIGSYVCERLVAAGAQVIVADDFSKGRLSNLQAIAGTVEIREGNLEQADAMLRALEGADVVMHLASRAYGVGYSSQHHLDMLAHNEAVTHALLTALAARPPRHVLVTSSSCVYPDDGPDLLPELPLFTGEPERANAGYGWAKRFLEQKSVVACQSLGIPLTIVRPFNIYGERYAWQEEASQAIPMLVKRLMDGENPMLIWGSGQQRRTYLHAADCAEIMVQLVENSVTGVVNIGFEDTVSMLELVQMLCRLSGRSPALVTDPSKPEGRRVKSSDATLLRRLCPQFSPSISLEEGLGRMLEWYGKEFA